MENFVISSGDSNQYESTICDDYELYPTTLLAEETCIDLLQNLIEQIQWHQDHYVAFNRQFSIPRLQAWYADDGIQYSYSNNLLKTQPWIAALKDIMQEIEELTHSHFNSVLVTYYRNGQDKVDWHADDEHELGDEPIIASLSLGATRKFQFRHKHLHKQGELRLKNGELMIMHPNFQKDWLHRVPEESNNNDPRINLTFRNVVKKSIAMYQS